mmetsp:Transcript_16622/g.42864  ORF Transcript_16622/g.42864 Transcript_16622/m.42864 type:complete len:259 (-) Transcript_16622:1033-1809(-)
MPKILSSSSLSVSFFLGFPLPGAAFSFLRPRDAGKISSASPSPLSAWNELSSNESLYTASIPTESTIWVSFFMLKKKPSRLFACSTAAFLEKSYICSSSGSSVGTSARICSRLSAGSYMHGRTMISCFTPFCAYTFTVTGDRFGPTAIHPSPPITTSTGRSLDCGLITASSTRHDLSSTRRIPPSSGASSSASCRVMTRTGASISSGDCHSTNLSSRMGMSLWSGSASMRMMWFPGCPMTRQPFLPTMNSCGTMGSGR